MKYLIAGLATACALLSTSAQAIPFHYKFNGTVQQAVFDPDNPFPHPVGPGAEIVGRVDFDTGAPDQVADPRVGSYAFTGAPWGVSLQLHDGGGQTNFFFPNFTIGVVDGMRDQYTVYAERGDPDGIDDFQSFEMHLEFPPFRLSGDALPGIPPAIDDFFLHEFTIRGVSNIGGQTYQYELIGTVDSVGVPEPGVLGLFLAGWGAMAVLRRHRARA